MVMMELSLQGSRNEICRNMFQRSMLPPFCLNRRKSNVVGWKRRQGEGDQAGSVAGCGRECSRASLWGPGPFHLRSLPPPPSAVSFLSFFLLDIICLPRPTNRLFLDRRREATCTCWRAARRSRTGRKRTKLVLPRRRQLPNGWSSYRTATLS